MFLLIAVDFLAVPETVTPGYEREARVMAGSFDHFTRYGLGAASPFSDRTAHALDSTGNIALAWVNPQNDVVLAGIGQQPEILSALPEAAPQGPDSAP
jgi:hypothetical protein